MPKKSDIERHWALDIIEIAKKYDDSLSDKPTWSILESYKGFSYEEIIEINITHALKLMKVKKSIGKWTKISDKAGFKEIGEKYTEEIANLYKDQAKVVGIGFLAWIVPVVAVYILGLIVRWIYKGFKAD